MMRLRHDHVLWLTMVVAATACTSEPTQILGVIETEMDAGVGLSGATVRTLTEQAEVYSEAVTDAEGVFDVAAPRGSVLFLEVSGEGLTTASFAGETGDVDLFEVPTGDLWAVPEATATAWRDRFAGCPGADGSEGFVVGQVLGWIGGTETAPVWPPSTATVLGEDNEPIVACYLDAKGLIYDPKAVSVGASGYFAVFGLSGQYLLDLGFPVSDDGQQIDTFPLYVPPGGIVTRFPSWVTPF